MALTAAAEEMQYPLSVAAGADGRLVVADRTLPGLWSVADGAGTILFQGKKTFRTPLNEGPVKVYVFFGSQPLNSASVSQQILDARDRQALSLMDMRLPGSVSLEVLDFEPEPMAADQLPMPPISCAWARKSRCSRSASSATTRWVMSRFTLPSPRCWPASS